MHLYLKTGCPHACSDFPVGFLLTLLCPIAHTCTLECVQVCKCSKSAAIRVHVHYKLQALQFRFAVT